MPQRLSWSRLPLPLALAAAPLLSSTCSNTPSLDIDLGSNWARERKMLLELWWMLEDGKGLSVYSVSSNTSQRPA
ncbi:uncharacterized protein CC84DRAFT_1163361 [Paraphaeosphaeria sporulosa]|uniref:Uncharacterized protein n=1 Tax=Paraphaeosphaeria sporulosa TaxID=1460663 RepID=A0A177CJV9_9PLEO|nr:uncharacterized protein CC84DRAFT_1163361 [Paraphaeosphaeria sporulosa]OAG07129.1 hypothetical protein CC84DRAFT_1163361 [Paraphaeosphaeria sporulosa]